MTRDCRQARCKREVDAVAELLAQLPGPSARPVSTKPRLFSSASEAALRGSTSAVSASTGKLAKTCGDHRLERLARQAAAPIIRVEDEADLGQPPAARLADHPPLIFHHIIVARARPAPRSSSRSQSRLSSRLGVRRRRPEARRLRHCRGWRGSRPDPRSGRAAAGGARSGSRSRLDPHPLPSRRPAPTRQMSPKSSWTSGAGRVPPSCSTMSGTVLLWPTISAGPRPGADAGDQARRVGGVVDDRRQAEPRGERRRGLAGAPEIADEDRPRRDRRANQAASSGRAALPLRQSDRDPARRPGC